MQLLLFIIIVFISSISIRNSFTMAKYSKSTETLFYGF